MTYTDIRIIIHLILLIFQYCRINGSTRCSRYYKKNNSLYKYKLFLKNHLSRFNFWVCVDYLKSPNKRRGFLINVPTNITKPSISIKHVLNVLINVMLYSWDYKRKKYVQNSHLKRLVKNLYQYVTSVKVQIKQTGNDTFKILLFEAVIDSYLMACKSNVSITFMWSTLWSLSVLN